MLRVCPYFICMQLYAFGIFWLSQAGSKVTRWLSQPSGWTPTSQGCLLEGRTGKLPWLLGTFFGSRSPSLQVAAMAPTCNLGMFGDGHHVVYIAIRRNLYWGDPPYKPHSTSNCRTYLFWELSWVLISELNCKRHRDTNRLASHVVARCSFQMVLL